jgi:hypothetical protein
MGWYSWWIRQQVKQMPQSLFAIVPGCHDPCVSESFLALWQETSAFLSNEANVSIDSLVDHLKASDHLTCDSSKKSQRLARSMAFAVIGWQTMLYRPDCGSFPPSQLAIVDELCGYREGAIMQLKQPESHSQQSLHQYLLGFGMLLPPSNFHLEDGAEHSKAFDKSRTVGSGTLNAALIVEVCHLTIKWTDCLACHLELDLTSNFLYLFRYPSFCVANRVSQSSGRTKHGTLHACAQPAGGTSTWGTQEDVSQMLEETLMSYRLLFGQNKKARKLFRILTPFEKRPKEGEDRLLNELCGRKASSSWLSRPDRGSYDLQHDFPILRSRLATLSYHMSERKPRTWRELWRDKRDSAQWFTFWAVLMIGGLGLIFSFAQVVLQIIQIALGRS